MSQLTVRLCGAQAGRRENLLGQLSEAAKMAIRSTAFSRMTSRLHFHE
jgi:hypothetical protein